MFQEKAVAEVSQRTAKKHKSDGPDGDGTTTDKAVHKMIWSLDARTRNLEGMIPSFFLSEDDKFIVPSLLEANKVYDTALIKGKPHPHGPRRTSLAAAFLNTIAKADLSKATPATTTMIATLDKALTLCKSPTIAEQQTILKGLLETFTSAQIMEPEVNHCSFFGTKKPGEDGKKRYYFSIAFSPQSMLRHIVEFVRVSMSAAGAKQTDGPPPLGPIIRDIPRYRS